MEVVRILMHLGATQIEVEHMHGWSRDFAASLNVPVGIDELQIGATVNIDQKSASRLLFKANLSGNQKPTLPEDLVWFPSEPSWQEIAEGRLKHGLKNFSLLIQHTDDFGINVGLKVKALRVGLDLGGNFVEYQSTTWQITGTFGNTRGYS